MKKLTCLLSCCCLFFLTAAYGEKAPDSVLKIIPDIKVITTNPVVIDAVKKQNAEHLSLDEIKRRDADWRKVAGVDDFMQSLLNNTAAKAMKKFEQSRPYYLELFLMDNQGANVAMTNKTSDYWQGDEAKWQKSFNEGKGATQVGKVEFDESAQAYLVQVSLPIMDKGKAIGAITVGINLDELEK